MVPGLLPQLGAPTHVRKLWGERWGCSVYPHSSEPGLDAWGQAGPAQSNREMPHAPSPRDVQAGGVCIPVMWTEECGIGGRAERRPLGSLPTQTLSGRLRCHPGPPARSVWSTGQHHCAFMGHLGTKRMCL